jgi:hypothetical protein
MQIRVLGNQCGSITLRSGMLVFGGVITVALIIVGVMESSGSGGSVSSPLQGIDQPLAGSSASLKQHYPTYQRCSSSFVTISFNVGQMRSFFSLN